MLGLRMVASYSPEYASFIDRIILRWNFCQIVTPDGQLQNGRAEQKQWRKQVESDVGFGSYSASIFELWGFVLRQWRWRLSKSPSLMGFQSLSALRIRAFQACR